MKQRLLVAAVGVPLLLVVLLVLPPIATTLLVCAIAAIAAYELVHTACKKPCVLIHVLPIVCAVVMVLVQACLPDYVLLPGLGLFLLLCLLAVCRFGTEKTIPFADVAIAMVGGVVFPLFYSCIALLRAKAGGEYYVLMPFVVAFLGDTFSMLGGMLLGKRKMAPYVSPNKTWAGFFAGPVGSALGMAVLGIVWSLLSEAAPAWWQLALIGLIANLFGQLGDLTMSLIKREVGIKDYSKLFLTHGGMLDRFDSSMFIAPVVLILVNLF